MLFRLQPQDAESWLEVAGYNAITHCTLEVVEEGDVVEITPCMTLESRTIHINRPECVASLPRDLPVKPTRFRYFGVAYFLADGGYLQRNEMIDVKLVERGGVLVAQEGFNDAMQVRCKSNEERVSCGGERPESEDGGSEKDADGEQ